MQKLKILVTQYTISVCIVEAKAPRFYEIPS
jgi:hypothetical protein